jgi:hypothetical protein
MGIHVQQYHTYLVPQPAVCICSLTNVSTSDACREPGCAWFFVDDISDDTTLADWYPGMNKHKHTPPYPLPFPCPAMPYLDPNHQSPARFANIEDMRTHAMRFRKFLLPHEPVCPCSSQPHIEFSSMSGHRMCIFLHAVDKRQKDITHRLAPRSQLRDNTVLQPTKPPLLGSSRLDAHLCTSLQQ